MSVHFEWTDVRSCGIDVVPQRFNVDQWDIPDEDSDPERTTSGPAFILGGDSGLVIEAQSPDQLVKFARTLLRMAEDFAAKGDKRQSA